MISVIVLAVLGLIGIAVTLLFPEHAAKNTFLVQFVTHEIIALMAVILTVTFASVANIHMSLNRILLERFKKNEKMLLAADGIKKELRDDAWIIFGGFIVMVVLLIVKGEFDKSDYVASSVNCAGIWLMALYIVCILDIYRVVFGLSRLELELGLASDNDASV